MDLCHVAAPHKAGYANNATKITLYCLNKYSNQQNTQDAHPHAQYNQSDEKIDTRHVCTAAGKQLA